jgi:hypothetical protein
MFFVLFVTDSFIVYVDNIIVYRNRFGKVIARCPNCRAPPARCAFRPPGVRVVCMWVVFILNGIRTQNKICISVGRLLGGNISKSYSGPITHLLRRRGRECIAPP